MDNNDTLDENDRRFIRRHWKMLSVFGVIGAAAVVAAVLVLTWFVATAQATGFVPAVLGEWTVGYFINFVLHLIFWELLLVGSWVAVVVGVLGYRWWNSLSPEEKVRPKRGRREGGDAFGFLIFITWLIVVWLDGRWALPFEAWTINNWVYSFLAAVGWDLLIFGIPILLGFVWWIRKADYTEHSFEGGETTES
jgi:hypothetical protein